jgi:hypothetical protein
MDQKWNFLNFLKFRIFLMKLFKNCSNVLYDLKNVKIVEKSLKIGQF